MTERATPNPEILAPRASRSLADRSIEKVLLACALVSVVAVIGIAAALLAEALPTGKSSAAAPVLADVTMTLALGTFALTALAILVALPLGLGAAIYLSEFASAGSRRWMKPALDLLAGVPTIVYGYFALQLITPALQVIVPGLAHKSALAAGLAMGIMILPLVASRSEEALSAVPKSLREGAYALGVSKWRAVTRVVLPMSLSGIVAAVVLAALRGVGEAMIVFIAAGSAPSLSLDPRGPIGTLAAFVVDASLDAPASGSLARRLVFVIGAALVVLTVSLDSLASRIGARRTRRAR